MAPSSRSRKDVVVSKIRHVLTAAGFDEALTLSTVEPELVEAFRPWTDAPALTTSTPVLRRANSLRQSIVPSLLVCRRTNETFSNPMIEQFEIAKVYLPRTGGLPEEKLVLAVASGGGYLRVKGVLEAAIRAIAPQQSLTAKPCQQKLLEPTRSATLTVAGVPVGVLGDVSSAGLGQFDLRGSATVAEIDLGLL